MEVVNVEEEAARLKEVTKVAAAAKDKDAEVASEAPPSGIPCATQVRTRRIFNAPYTNDGSRT